MSDKKSKVKNFFQNFIPGLLLFGTMFMIILTHCIGS